MLDAQIHSFLKQLNENQKKAVLAFLKSLIKKPEDSSKSASSDKKYLSAYGSLKGKIEMKPGFDDTPDEFFNAL
jgi:hypothetical protein